MLIDGTGFASIAFGYPNALWGEPQSPPAVEKGEKGNVFCRNGSWRNGRRSLWNWDDVLCSCRKAGGSADGTDADTQTEEGRTENNPFPGSGREGEVLPFGWRKSLHDGRGRNERDWALPLCGWKTGGCKWAGLGDWGIPPSDGTPRDSGVSLRDSRKER